MNVLVEALLALSMLDLGVSRGVSLQQGEWEGDVGLTSCDGEGASKGATAKWKRVFTTRAGLTSLSICMHEPQACERAWSSPPIGTFQVSLIRDSLPHLLTHLPPSAFAPHDTL